MNDFCNNCNSCGHDPCSCGGCRPASYKCDFDIQANPYDASIWNVTICGAMTKVKIPKLNETDTKLSTNYSNRSLIYNAERHTDIISGEQLGALIDLKDLRDTDAANADSCDLLVFNPGCNVCGDACKPKNAMWKNYHIPDAGECVLEVDDDGYYHVLIKDDCGCIKECRLPVMPEGSTTINYVRDSVPDDPDFPWYYGCYNDTINLYLAQNAERWFGKYDLDITVNYSIQVLHPTAAENMNFRSLVLPIIEGMEPDPEHFVSILQGQSTTSYSAPYIPWGTVCYRGSFQFVAPKGKDASLRHEFRLRSRSSGSGYASNATYDRKKVPDDIAGHVDLMQYTASRLNSLQIIVKPTRGVTETNPVTDPYRDMLDSGTAADDIYPNVE